jgi:site-specific DNA-methyltransferase (adenine-specific)
VLRDITERVVVASKGRFDRARPAGRRAREGLPSESTLRTDDFLALTLDVWSIPPESARRVGHPAPFPVELPAQLIRLYTYAGDLVLDPFMGSGSTLVAAAGLGRRYVGYDLDPDYVEIARRRVAEAGPLEGEVDERGAEAIALEVLAAAGFTVVGRRRRLARAGLAVDVVLTDSTGTTWHADVAGPSSAHRGGLARTDVVWRALGRVAAARGRAPDVPFLLLTTDLPRRGGDGDTALRAAGPGILFDVVDVFDAAARARLAAYAAEGPGPGPRPGFWDPPSERDR